MTAPACRNARTSGDDRAATTKAGVEKTTTRSATTPRASSRNDLSTYYDRALRRFALADFLKPQDGSAPDDVIKMSPLIVLEVPNGKPDLQFGVPIDATMSTSQASESSQPIVYYTEDRVTIDRIERNRIAFLWLFDWPRDGGNGVELRAQGIRLTLDKDGYAVFSEALSSWKTPHVIFAARSMEDEAEAEFGTPEPSRRFAIERSAAQAPDTVVARILSDGPQPMGPFVYIGGSHHDVTTLLCRCMASQIEAFRKNSYYRLQPLPTAGDDSSASLSMLRALLSRADESPLEQIIRVPTKFATTP